MMEALAVFLQTCSGRSKLSPESIRRIANKVEVVKIVSLLLIGLTANILPAQAINCARASKPVEQAICVDPALKALDDRMTVVYDALRKASSADERKDLAKSQRKWIALREDHCSGSETSACIRDKTNERMRLLLVEPLSGPGAPETMLPFFIQQDANDKFYNVDYALIRFAGETSPGARAFNKEVKKIADTAPLKAVDDEMRPGIDLSSETSMEISYASPRLISAAVSHYSYDGGAHGNGGVDNINIDMRKGVLLTIDQLLGEAQAQELFKSCRAQILVQKTEKNDGGSYDPADDPSFQDSTISEHIAQMSRWTFTEKKAIVTFDQYAIGAYAEGPYECEFSMDVLRASVLPDAPFP